MPDPKKTFPDLVPASRVMLVYASEQNADPFMTQPLSDVPEVGTLIIANADDPELDGNDAELLGAYIISQED